MPTTIKNKLILFNLVHQQLFKKDVNKNYVKNNCNFFETILYIIPKMLNMINFIIIFKIIHDLII